ncbi:acyltransferase [Paraferrimonas sedimenticola]|uniref:N-acetyltransferase n=1 Tax=Paraferrimonas sedimenticola TaxID=375674 RepID=A0AA37RXE8_9GAMM|nr:acyltransferase [Paraferrimonas sedimenticola]GLP96743.1 N-acetyltransferase [Paraferrimonas sedimenticola]
MENTFFAHATAEVSPKASIGAGSKVWNLTQIREDVVIGDDCILSKNVYIDFGVKIGNRVKVQNNVSVYNGVTIEDDVFVGPCAVFTNDMTPRAVNPEWKVTETLVKHGASLGANCTVVCGNTIGRYAMVAAGSTVTKDVPDHALVMGNPARIAGYVYRTGERVSLTHIQSAKDGVAVFINPQDGEELQLQAGNIQLR